MLFRRDEVGVPHPGDTILQRYVVESVLGVGGMGMVLAARHTQLGQRVAIKIIAAGGKPDDEEYQRLLSEARAAVRIRSQHITKVIDFETDSNGRPHIVMELLDGTNLAALVRNRGPLPIDETVGYVLHACEALRVAHQAGVVHRDIKPDNLFLTQREDGLMLVKVLDFGVSTMTGAAPSRRSSDNEVVGSVPYMSPEQLTAPSTVDARTDIWGIGTVLFELLAGRPPFVGNSLEALISAIVAEPLPSLRQLRPDLPAPLEAVVMSCLSRVPADRFPNVESLSRVLEQWAPVWAAPNAPGFSAPLMGTPGTPLPVLTASVTPPLTPSPHTPVLTPVPMTMSAASIELLTSTPVFSDIMLPTSLVDAQEILGAIPSAMTTDVPVEDESSPIEISEAHSFAAQMDLPPATPAPVAEVEVSPYARLAGGSAAPHFGGSGSSPSPAPAFASAAPAFATTAPGFASATPGFASTAPAFASTSFGAPGSFGAPASAFGAPAPAFGAPAATAWSSPARYFPYISNLPGAVPTDERFGQTVKLWRKRSRSVRWMPTAILGIAAAVGCYAFVQHPLSTLHWSLMTSRELPGQGATTVPFVSAVSPATAARAISPARSQTPAAVTPPATKTEAAPVTTLPKVAKTEAAPVAPLPKVSAPVSKVLTHVAPVVPRVAAATPRHAAARTARQTTIPTSAAPVAALASATSHSRSPVTRHGRVTTAAPRTAFSDPLDGRVSRSAKRPAPSDPLDGRR